MAIVQSSKVSFRNLIGKSILLFQVEMSGSSVFDYVHPQDHAEIAEQLGLSLSSSQSLASPSSGISEDGSGNQGTNNPDGMSSLRICTIYQSITVDIFNFNLFFLHVDSFISNVNNFPNSVQRIRTSILCPNEINANKTRMPFQIVRLSGKHERFIS